VVITQHPNGKNAEEFIVSAPTLICRSGESAEMRVGDEDEDLIDVQVDTAENPGTDEMTFTVMVRERGLLRSRTFLKVQPDEGASTTSTMAGDMRAK